MSRALVKLVVPFLSNTSSIYPCFTQRSFSTGLQKILPYSSTSLTPFLTLWIKDKKKGKTQIQFIEPHGLHHGGLAGNQDKIDALKELQKLSEDPSFQRKKIAMGGYLVTQTKLRDIPDARDKTWEDLERDY